MYSKELNKVPGLKYKSPNYIQHIVNEDWGEKIEIFENCLGQLEND